MNISTHHSICFRGHLDFSLKTTLNTGEEMINEIQFFLNDFHWIFSESRENLKVYLDFFMTNGIQQIQWK